MTDNQFPILADGLFDGGLAADVAPKDLRAAVTLLNAAGRPGSEAELATMTARVRQFSAEINAAAKAPNQAAITQVPNSTAAFVEARRPYDPHMSDDTLRSNPMFATRITRKALTIVAITLLAAGTAAAAAGGALPMFEKDKPKEVVVHPPVEPKVIDDFSSPTDDEQPAEDSPPVNQAASVIASLNADEVSDDSFVTPGVSDKQDDKGSENEPADDKPAVTTQPADEAAANPADDSGDDDESQADDPEVPSTTTPGSGGDGGTGTGTGNGSGGNGNAGNGNGGNGNGGNGNGGNGNGNDDHDNDDDGEHGNGGHGNGNSGHGSGNSGHGNGNSGNGHGKGKGH